MLQMLSSHEFAKAVKKDGPEHCARGFKSWEHFAARLACASLMSGLATRAQNLFQPEVKPIHRATLEYANEHRSQRNQKGHKFLVAF